MRFGEPISNSGRRKKEIMMAESSGKQNGFNVMQFISAKFENYITV
jgi:hypothetical protein